MKRLTKKIFAVLMVLLISFSAFSSSTLHIGSLKLGHGNANANSNIMTYKFDVSRVELSNYTSTPPVGTEVSLTVDFSNNTYTTSHTGYNIKTSSYADSEILHGPYTSVEDNVGGWYTYYFKAISSTTGTINSTGASYLKSLSVGSMINLSTTMKSGSTVYESNIMTAIKTISTGGGSGGSCGPYTDSNTWEFKFPVSRVELSGYTSNPPVGSTVTLTVDFASNTFKSSHTGYNIKTGDVYSYNSGALNGSNVRVEDNNAFGGYVMAISSTSGTVTYDGVNYLKSMSAGQYFTLSATMTYGSTVYESQVYTEMTTVKKGVTVQGTPCTTTPPPPTTTTVYPKTCSAGLTPKGTPGTASFYCEKPVDKMNNVNVNLGDIVNNLDGKDFGGANDHNSSLVINGGDGNKNQTVNNLDGKDSNFVNFTNVPVDGKITSLTNIWKPEFTVTYKGKLLKAPKPTDATQLQQFNTALSEFTSQSGTDVNSHSQVEVIAYKVNAIEELNAITKNKESLISIFEKDSSGNYLSKDKIKFVTIDKQGFNNYDELKINQEGLYILATKYIDQTKQGTLPDKTTYTFKPIEISFLNTLGYLPISNYVVGQVNDMYMSIGLKKKDHGLSNLKYSNESTSYKSMKVPSSHNYKNNHSFVGSTNGGFSLVDPSLNKVPVVSSTFDVAEIKVSDVVDNGAGFFISSDKGISYLDVDTKTVSATSIANGVLDLEVINETMYILSEDKLKVFFIVGKELLPSVKEYDLTGLFSSNKKPGKFEVIGDIISVSTIDEGDESEVIFLTTK